MPSGDYRERIELQRPVRTVNGAGETVVTWTAVRKTWAQVKPLKAWQMERARAVEMRTSHVVKLRYAADVDGAGDWRIAWRGQVLNILGIVNPEGRNVELEISCEQERSQ